MSSGILTFYTALLAKGVIIVLLVLYNLFAFIIIRQIDTMNRMLPTAIGGLLKVLAIIHFILALILLAISFGIL